jgi:hypothetical protein
VKPLISASPRLVFVAMRGHIWPQADTGFPNYSQSSVPRLFADTGADPSSQVAELLGWAASRRDYDQIAPFKSARRMSPQT